MGLRHKTEEEAEITDDNHEPPEEVADIPTEEVATEAEVTTETAPEEATGEVETKEEATEDATVEEAVASEDIPEVNEAVQSTNEETTEPPSEQAAETKTVPRPLCSENHQYQHHVNTVSSTKRPPSSCTTSYNRRLNHSL